MEQTCLVLPLRPGSREISRVFLRALRGPRADELARSERRLGIERQAWFTAGEGTDLLIGMIEARDFARAMSLLAISMEPFDLWFKRSIEAITGLDLNDAPARDSAARLLAYVAESAWVPVMVHPSTVA
jgi:hypothetical protein